jgi:hypothetical protein
MQVNKAQVVEILRSRGDHGLADRVNAECPAAFDPSDVELLRNAELGIDATDAARHANDGSTEDMSGLPTSP